MASERILIVYRTSDGQTRKIADRSRDHEYTDWGAVDRFADDVLVRVRT